ncbi:MAG: ribonuclease BN, partial [Gammaproteobacteria bacterium]
YGAAGSLMAMLIWVYYSCQILFFGAELTQAYAAAHGSRASGLGVVQPVAAAAPAPAAAAATA